MDTNPFTSRTSYAIIICHSFFEICGQIPLLLRFKWNLCGTTFARYYLFLCILFKQIVNVSWTFSFATIWNKGLSDLQSLAQ